MMKLLSVWKDSLSPFAPKNFRRFLLVTLNTIKQSYAVFLWYWWWLLPLSAFLYDFPFHFVTGLVPLSANNHRFFEGLLAIILYASLIFLFFLSMRPSVDRKNFRYFAHYIFYDTYFILSSIGLSYFGNSLLADKVPFRNLQFLLLIVLFITQYFFTMFLLDSDGSCRSALFSVYRAVKMVVYNIPFALVTVLMICIMSTSMMFCMVGFAKLLDYFELFNVLNLQAMFCIMVFLPHFVVLTMAICFVANFYTQKVYEQYRLYFNDNE